MSKLDRPFIMAPDDERNLMYVPEADRGAGQAHSVSGEEAQPILYRADQTPIFKRKQIGFRRPTRWT